MLENVCPLDKRTRPTKKQTENNRLKDWKATSVLNIQCKRGGSRLSEAQITDSQAHRTQAHQNPNSKTECEYVRSRFTYVVHQNQTQNSNLKFTLYIPQRNRRRERTESTDRDEREVIAEMEKAEKRESEAEGWGQQRLNWILAKSIYYLRTTLIFQNFHRFFFFSFFFFIFCLTFCYW